MEGLGYIFSVAHERFAVNTLLADTLEICSSDCDV